MKTAPKLFILAAVALGGTAHAAHAAPPCATFPIIDAVIRTLRQQVDVYGNRLGGFQGEPFSLGGGLWNMQMCGADAATNLGKVSINYTVALASSFGLCRECGVLTSDGMYFVKVNAYWPVDDNGNPQ